jgi:superfamily II DNA or RNA helicase
MAVEFIIALTEHRSLGNIFAPYLIDKSGDFYTVISHVTGKKAEVAGYKFTDDELEFVKLVANYSDENLARKFSRSPNISAFYETLTAEYFQKHISPYIEKYLCKIARQLMKSKTRLLLKDVRYANLYDEDEIKTGSTFAEAIFNFERTESETRYFLQILQDGKELGLLNKKTLVITEEPCVMVYQDKLLVFEDFNAKRLAPFFTKEFISIPKPMEEKYYESFILNTLRENKVKVKGFPLIEDKGRRKVELSLEKGLKYEPVFVLRFYYGDSLITPNSKRLLSVSLHKKGGQFIFVKENRDSRWEQEITQVLTQAGLIPDNGYYYLDGYDLLDARVCLYNMVNWLNRNKQVLTANNIDVVQSKLDKTYFSGEQELKMEVTGVSDWFDVYAVVRFGDYSIPFIKLKKYILNDIREFELPNGEIAILPEEWFARYKELLPLVNPAGENLKISKHHFPLLGNSFIKNQEILGKFENFRENEIQLPENLNATLRPYQITGFRWLSGLQSHGFGGCLADDMGLGKTLQAITLLLKLKRQKKVKEIIKPQKALQLDLFSQETEEPAQPASLIIVPTSLVFNWENEIKRFAPSLRVLKYTGNQRRESVNFEEATRHFDIILTTYGTVRNDIEFISETDLFYIILDEGQYIKNPASKIYKAILRLKSKYKLVLTGTPIENSLTDLWSQMNFMNRGMLGNLAFFKHYFVLPIEKKNDLDVIEKLRLMIRPYILRRKKEEVATDLPPLMEQIRYCQMGSEQRSIYEREKSAIRNAILQNIENEGVEKSSFLVLQGLTKLRQLANHPSLLNNDEEFESGKFNEIFNALTDLVAENHKVLVFSSFVTHLELLEKRIAEEGWKYSKLTGQTAGREKVITQFKSIADNRIFLISLKAGGVGLNLADADYVFIIDPWWNPAAEMQAISRSHRIGQEKHVFVYRFITEDSIEEKIQILKDKKSKLADKFVNSNNPFKEITKEEIEDLLK